MILTDAILAGIVGLTGFVFGWRTAEAFGAAMVRTGMLVILFACLMGMGGFAARVGDAAAYSLSGAGNMSENLLRIAESGQSSLGCFFLLLISGLGLMSIGCLRPVIPVQFG